MEEEEEEEEEEEIALTVIVGEARTGVNSLGVCALGGDDEGSVMGLRSRQRAVADLQRTE